ncbi:Hint domain-containing protein [Acidisoma silvae]|uniref:Hint domain-containing protein n=1 Tax=Acidisoma silvae TaxID=2802396 RepID=A0A963YUI3_9PROT|nr:Hint domain-containing protein [Acidisoma silvae]MCB8877315.1 Hint domain-containing protein [Acidisoma silvae]
MATITVTNLNDSGAGSLREAIEEANSATGGSSTIVFSVSGTVTLDSDLPDITSSVTIDATSAPGATAGGAPIVGIDFNGNSGLTFASGSNGSSLLGVSVGGAAGNGITIESSDVTIAGDYVGLSTSGTVLANSGDGINIAATSSGNTIGSNPTAASGVVSNVISGNGGNGVQINGSSDNTLVNNYIGTDPTGSTAIANGENGILITNGATNNLIGGTAYTDTSTGAVNDPTGDKGTVAPVFVTPPLGNLVSGNTGNGILISDNSENNVLSGNYVGTTASGNAALGNGGDGVAIDDSDNNSLIGCTALENPFVYYNVVSGNGGNGLHITNSDDTTVQANFFGIGADNATIVGNAGDGILVDGDSSVTQVGGVIPLGNVSAGNGENGIEVADTASHFISFNTFGGLFAFGAAAPNGNDGILITSTGGFNTLQTNVLSGNVNDGIEIGGDASGVTVDPNIVGLQTNGQAFLTGGGNGNDGLEIDGTAHDNIIGGDQQSVIPENTFSGNANYGVEITGQAYDNQVFSSDIGTDVLGTYALANGAGGILISGQAHDNTIGGTVSAGVRAADIVSGNDGPGITLGDATSNTTITNNIIGYGTEGTQPIPNHGAPIDTGASTGNTIADNQTFACFAQGTRIATPSGDVAVEDLAEGDLVLTLDGAAQPIAWIGRRTVDCARHDRPAAIRPVRVTAGAFAAGQPARDLFISPDHAVFAEEVFIPVKHLINGSTIRQTDWPLVTYFHIELPRHSVIFAEGLATESYLDTGDRASFANGGAALALHPLFGQARQDVTLIWEARAYAPLCVTGAEVARVRALLVAMAARRQRVA